MMASSLRGPARRQPPVGSRPLGGAPRHRAQRDYRLRVDRHSLLGIPGGRRVRVAPGGAIRPRGDGGAGRADRASGRDRPAYEEGTQQAGSIKDVFKGIPEKGRLAVTTPLSDVKWVRVLLAGVATHVVNVVVSVVLIVAYSLLTIGPGGHPNTGSVDWFANPVSTW